MSIILTSYKNLEGSVIMFRIKKNFNKKLIWGIIIFIISHFLMYRIIEDRLKTNTPKQEDLIFQFNEKYISCNQISEFEIYKNFSEISKGKTTLFISHRLSSCRFCDEIIVLDKGSIVQQDTHDNLLKNEEGKYYNLWNAQAKYYI